MKALIAEPVNSTQREFNKLCELGGGQGGGPARGKVLELLRASGQRLNAMAFRQVGEQMSAFPEANPWHVCFAIGLCWGHLAWMDVDFTKAVIGVLSNWNDADLSAARKFHMERGPEPIEQSLRGGYMLFDKVLLPGKLPDTLERLWRAQERWLTPVLSPTRPKYIGSWNATAMFMIALFAQPALARTQREPKPLLPPGGPIFEGLKLLHRARLLSRAPSGGPLDDQAFEPGVLYENNELFSELHRGRNDWGLIDVHSGVYMLGTRHPHSDNWA
jgi:hypothetical protein